MQETWAFIEVKYGQARITPTLPSYTKQPPICERFKEFSLSNRSHRPAADQFLTRAIASLLTLNLIANDCRLRLLHFHVNLIKKKKVTDCKWNIMEAQKLIKHITTDCVKGPFCAQCRTNVGDSGRVMLKLFTATQLYSGGIIFSASLLVYLILCVKNK